MTKKILSFSEILQKNIDKINKRQADNLKYIQEIKTRQKLNEPSQDEPSSQDNINAIDIMEMLK